MAISPSEMEEYRDLLTEVNRLAQEDLVALWQSLDDADRDRLWEGLRAGVPEIVAMYRATAADTAMLFYNETQGLSFSAEEGLAASRINREQIEASLRWAVFSPGNVAPLSLVGGILQKHVIDGSRQYGLRGFASGGDRWVRAARAGACEFCRMLATRAVNDWGPYSSAEAAVTVGSGPSSRGSNQPRGAAFHDNCMCIPVRADDYEIPSYVEKWTSDYYAATREVGNAFDYKSILSVMRQQV